MSMLIDRKAFVIGRMSSGRLYAELTSEIGWEGFPDYAEKFVNMFSGRIVSKNDSVDCRVWGVLLNNQSLRLVYEDFPLMITLESQSDGGDEFIEALGVVLSSGG